MKRRKAPDAESTVLPLELVRDFLTCHPFVKSGYVTVHDAHRALRELHEFTVNGFPQTAATPTTTTTTTPRVCDHVDYRLQGTLIVCETCGMTRDAFEDDSDHLQTRRDGVRCVVCNTGYMVLDTREGTKVCNTCGIVAACNLNFIPDYVEWTHPGAAARTTSASYGISRAAAVCHGAQTEFHRLTKDLHHWNQFSNLSQDQLDHATYVLSRWRGGHHSGAARVAALLLYPSMQEAQCLSLSALDIRAHVHKAAAQRMLGGRRPAHVAVYQPRTPAPPYACRECGHKSHSAKEARFHCRLKPGSG